MVLGTPEIFLILVWFVIPLVIIMVIVRLFRKSQRLKKEQIELLKKILEKLK